MSEKKEFLTEENYERGKKKLKMVAIIVLVIGLLIGGSLITVGILKQSKTNSNYSEDTIKKLQNDIEAEKVNLETKKTELEGKRDEALRVEKQNLENKKQELISKGIKYNNSTKYDDGESYDLKVITNVLDPSFNYCAFDEYKNNGLTKDYCLLSSNKDEDSIAISAIESVLSIEFNYCVGDTKNNMYTSRYCSLVSQLNDKSDFNKEFDSYDSIPFYIIGGFIIIASCMFAGSIYMTTKQREILAFHAQQVMPVAQEGIEKMAPTIGKTGASITKEMAPAYGEIAKEISKGIKEGLKNDDEK